MSANRCHNVPVIVSSNTIKVVHRNNHCLKIGVKIFYSAILNINVNIVFVFFILNLFNFINPKANIINETIPSNHMYITDIATVNIITNITI